MYNNLLFCCQVMSSCLRPPWTAAHQASLSFTISQSLLKVISVESVMPSNHLILCHPFSCFQAFPTSGSFPVGQLFKSGGQSIGASASASVLLMNIQGWFPLGLIGLISLQPVGLSRIFSSTIIWKHQFLGTQPSLWSIHDYWKNHRSINGPWLVKCLCVLIHYLSLS